MNKTLFVIFGLVFALILSTTAYAIAPLTVVSGKVTLTNGTGVEGASVAITCEHLGFNTTQAATTNSLGNYYSYFSSLNCDAGDNVWVEVEDGGMEGSGFGIVAYSQRCYINTVLIDVTIPEFTVIAATMAAIAGIGIIVYRRKD